MLEEKRLALREKLAAALEVSPDELTDGTRLPGLEGWDSLAVVMVVAAADELGCAVDGRKVAAAGTVGELYAVCGLGLPS